MTSLEERRQCPCIHLVEVRGEFHSEVELLKLNMSHCKASSTSKMERVIKDFQESNLAIKECLLNMQKSSLMFIEGNQKFIEITRLQTETNISLNTHKRWLIYLSFVTICLVGVSFFNGHATTILSTISALLQIK